MSLPQQATGGSTALPLLGTSPPICRLRKQIDRIAPYSTSVLIHGPTGSGKELVARQLHARNNRHQHPFMPVDCASVSGDLMASQLFGHREGAFTGANYSSLGVFRAASGGTIFLDEIGELELALQARLLRVLQERVVVPVGEHREIPVDFRLVAATHRDLRREVAAGRFREDLFFRIAVVILHTTALLERPEDIRVLADHFLRQMASEGLPAKSLSPGALEVLTLYAWPGNIRQLRNVIEQSLIECEGPMVTQSLIRYVLREFNQYTGSEVPGSQASPMAPTPVENQQASPEPITPEDSTGDRCWLALSDLERSHILHTLKHTYYNRSAAARLLGITRQSLIRKMKKHHLAVPDHPGKHLPQKAR